MCKAITPLSTKTKQNLVKAYAPKELRKELTIQWLLKERLALLKIPKRIHFFEDKFLKSLQERYSMLSYQKGLQSQLIAKATERLLV
jgi:hypothetical protein